MALLSTNHKIRLDLGTFCNLECPSCFRQAQTKEYNKENNTNLSYHPYLNKHWVTIDKVKRWFPEPFLKERINRIVFDGATAEPSLNSDILKIIDYLSPHVDRLEMSTTASTRNPDWWYELGKTKIYPTFSIDSFKPNNNLYRINQNTQKVIENMRAFTKAGGKCALKHIMFKHNQDEIPQFTKFAEEIGARYRRVAANEFVDKDSYEVNSHGKTYTLEKNTLIERNKPFRLEKGKQKPWDYCLIASGSKTIIVHALGVVYPCCHIEGEFFSFYSDYFTHGDPKPKDRQHNPQIYDDFIRKIETQGGIKSISLEYNTLEEIMNTRFYKSTLEFSWKVMNNQTCMNCKNWKYYVE